MRRRREGPVGRGGGSVAVLLLVALLTSGCGSPEPSRLRADASAAAPTDGLVAPARATATVAPEGLQPALDAVAAAFRAGDPSVLRTWLLDPESTFGRRWLDRVEAMTALPLAHYALRLDPTIGELTTDRVRARYDDPATVVRVVEELALDGFDDPDRPATESLYLTVVATADGWRVAGDRDAEALGLVSVDHLWDHGPVAVTRRGPVLAIHHPGSVDLDPVVDDAVAAVELASERWPLAWPRRVPLLVPRDEQELAELLHVTFDLSNFVAFATATVSGERGDYRIAGSRVTINPARFLQRDPSTRRSILVHELVHVASQSVGGPFVPSWLDEGVAQALGERRSTTGTRLLDALVTDDVRLPLDGQFTTGGRDRIFLSYQLAWSFVEHLRASHGAEAVARFYAEAGEGGIGRPGTEAWHVDRAARAVFGVGIAELEADWRGS